MRTPRVAPRRSDDEPGQRDKDSSFVSDFIREDIVSNPRETSYAVWLSESDVVALKAGVVTPYLQQYAVRLLAMVA